ncbi:hypothetical protein GS528_07380 [Rhodococcus hoagii]|nr:hypothetical protein [Prescottella equi]
MSWLWIALGAWFVLALAAAVLIGRGIRRADSEEIGSTLDWDVTKLDTEDPSQIRDASDWARDAETKRTNVRTLPTITRKCRFSWTFEQVARRAGITYN